MSRGPRKHPWGCTCKTHVDRPWNRPEHWTQAEVDYLEEAFGKIHDETIARRLGRSVVGMRLKAKRLGLHKRTVGFTARAVAQVFGIDSSMVGKVWIRRGLLPAIRLGKAYRNGNTPAKTMRGGRFHAPDPYERPIYWTVSPAAVERFIVEHPEHVDVDKMPDSPYRELAARDPWISLPEVHRRTGRNTHAVALLIRAGVVRGRRRGAHWYMPVADLPKVPPLRTLDAIEESAFRRASVLEMRRNRRKGAVPRLGSGRSSLPVVQRVAS